MTSKYKYTVDNNLLSEEQRQFYEENGFILIKNLVEHSILDECAQRFRDICNGVVPRNNITLMRDISLSKTNAKGEYLYNKIQDISWDDVFSKFTLHPRVLDYVECFVGPDVSSMHTMCINKPPDSGKMTSTHPLHQDLHYFSFRPADRICAAWTAMEKVTKENGCLIVLPGTHKLPHLRHDYPQWEGGVNKAYLGVKGYDDHPVVHCEMDKGDTLFFHPLLLHGSGPNLTKGFRKAMCGHYATTHHYHIDVTGTVQENISKEIEEMSKIRGIPATFQSQWSLTSRLARGKPRANL